MALAYIPVVVAVVFVAHEVSACPVQRRKMSAEKVRQLMEWTKKTVMSDAVHVLSFCTGNTKKLHNCDIYYSPEAEIMCNKQTYC